MDEKHRKKKESLQEKRESAEKSEGVTHPKAGTEEKASAEAPVEQPVDVEDLKVKARERGEFLDMLQRTYAEYSNYRKRIERERGEWSERAVADFVKKLLPVLDDFDRALLHAENSTDVRSLAEGIRLIEDKIYGVLRTGGVEAFEPETGKPFNPAEQEVLVVEVTGDLPDGTVTEVLLKGYRLRERVLRPAKVKVTKKPPAAPGAETPAEAAPSSEEKPSGPPETATRTDTEKGNSDANV